MTPIDLSTVPARPGVYTFKGPKERVLYVGKAKSLRNRLRSYFQKGAALDTRKASMVRSIRDVSYIVTANELEALALEANLIKQYKPKFNVILRDDKNYPYLKLTVNEEWPRLEVVRKIKKDGALYFGPYVPTSGMWEALSFIRRHFNIRPCTYKLDKPMRPCLEHQMGRCPAPCAGYVERKDYLKGIEEVALFLKGQKKELIGELEHRMQVLSAQLRFEEAAKLRDRIAALMRAWETQKVIAPELGDLDVIGHHREGGRASFQVFLIRNGIMTGAKDFKKLDNVSGMPDGELMHGFIEIFYAKEIIPPPEIVLGARPDEPGSLKTWLRERRGGPIKITVPKSGIRLELLKMAAENARLRMTEKAAAVKASLGELKERLSLAVLPRRIGAFDVSTIAGAEPVGAFIYWADGEFKKDNYRHMRIKTVSGVDDYAMMAETIRRTLADIGEMGGADLILIDGGKAHLEAAMEAARGFKLSMIAVAKEPDRLFTPDSGEAVSLEDGKPSSLLLKRIRDEAHRFAVGYHRKLRGRRFLKSPLEELPGIGKKRRLALLKHFGSLDAIRKAETEELLKVPGMNRKAAAAVKEALGEEASKE